MATHYQVTNYPDFKAVAQALTAGKVFRQDITGTTSSYLWFVSTDGNFIVSNVSNTAGSSGFVLPGTFGADFPGAITLTAAAGPPSTGLVAIPGLILSSD